MTKRHLIGVLFASCLLAAPAATAGTFTVRVVPVIQPGNLANELVIGDGGGGGGAGSAGCWRAYVSSSGSNWTTSSWRHHFNPLWCGNGSVVTHVDANWHYQTTSGFYGPNGVSRWVIGGCVGCNSIQFHAQARFSFNFMGWTSYINSDRYITLYGWNGKIAG